MISQKENRKEEILQFDSAIKKENEKGGSSVEANRLLIKILQNEIPNEKGHFKRLGETLDNLAKSIKINSKSKIPFHYNSKAMNEFTANIRFEKNCDYLAAAKRWDTFVQEHPKATFHNINLTSSALEYAAEQYFLANRINDAKIRWQKIINLYPKSDPNNFSADYALYYILPHPNSTLYKAYRDVLILPGSGCK